MENKLVSVIIPAYNAEKTIENCIESVLAQTYPNFEVIIVDDGSSDSTGTICKSFAEKDNRIKYYYQDNSGVSSARNYGIEMSTGEYIEFLDSDDRLKNNLIEENLKLAIINKADIVIFGFEYINPETKDSVKNEIGDFCGNAEEFFREKLIDIVNTETLNAPWNKLINASLIRKYNLKFNETYSICEDILFSLQCIEVSPKIVVNSKAYYEYFLQEQFSLRTKYHANFLEAAQSVYKTGMRYCAAYNNNDTQVQRFINLFAGMMIAQIKRVVKNGDVSEAEMQAAITEICSDELYRQALKKAIFSKPLKNVMKKNVIRQLILMRKTRLLMKIYKMVR